ncbi:MAG TPA: FHA domain-containing protein [Verrucomicrobiae bacterium]|nr:FHA domain-containing protein [Verrucomicrobiae bacterium]
MSQIGGALALEAVDGATVSLERFPIVVGRLVADDQVPDVDVGHLDPSERVAPAHCRLTADGDGLLVHDLGSPAGTWVDGSRVRAGHPRHLFPGGRLRVGEVVLTLVRVVPADPTSDLQPSTGALPARGAPVGVGPPGPEPAPSGERPAVPPPPSATSAAGDRPGAAPPGPAPAGRDSLAGTAPDPTPPMVASPAPEPTGVGRWLREGAEGVRLSPGSPAMVRRDGEWVEEGPALTEATVETAIAAARRLLGLRDARPAGVGRGGGLLVDWVMPPLARSAHLVAEVESREPTPLPDSLRAALAAHLGHGRALLVVAPWPAPVLAALAMGVGAASRPRALPAEADAWWVPSGWPLFAGVPELADDLDTLLAGSVILVERPSAAELQRLVARAPHGQSALVVGVEAFTVQVGLERVRAALIGGGRRETGPRSGSSGAAAVERAFPAVLCWARLGLELLQLSAEDGQWRLRPRIEGFPP